MKFIQLIDDPTEEFEVQKMLILRIFQNKLNYKHHFHDYQVNKQTISLTFFINGKEFTIRRLDWVDFIKGNNSKKSFIGIFGSLSDT